MVFPADLPSLPDPATRTEGDGATLRNKLVVILTAYKAEIEGIAIKVGATSSADTSSIDYKLTRAVEQLAVFGHSGTIAINTGTTRFRFPWAVTILGTTAAVGTTPSGANIILDIKRNGSSIYTTTTNRPTILAGVTATVSEPSPDISSFAAGDYLTVDILQVGSSTPGSDLTTFVRYRRT